MPFGALKSHRPKVRYYMPFPTHLLAWLKRLLSHSVLGRALLGVGRWDSR